MQAIVQGESAKLHLESRGRGTPVVLVHGGPGIYDYLSDSALGRWLADNHTVVGYDQRGCRHSPSDGPFTVDDSVLDVVFVSGDGVGEEGEEVGRDHSPQTTATLVAGHKLTSGPSAASFWRTCLRTRDLAL